jgi:hypothetical protein
MRTAFFAALLAATVPTLASAQGGSFETTVGGGVTIPMGTSADLYQTGFHGAASIGYRALDSKAVFKLHASLHRLNQDAFTDAHANIFAAFARIDYDVSPMAYVIGGLGIVRNENQALVSGVRFTNTNSDPAMTAGVGIRFGKNFFTEGRLMYGFGDPKSTLIPVTIGLRF